MLAVRVNALAHDGDTAVVWNRITLLAEVRGTEVTNPFTVTEVYQREGGAWTLLALTFSSIRDGHEIRRVVSNLAVLDFEAPDRRPDDGLVDEPSRMRLRSVHPGVTVDQVVEATGFELVVPDEVPESRLPTDEELHLIREVLDPHGYRKAEFGG